MEYTRSVGDDYATFEGTPKEIAELVKLIGDNPQPVGRKLSVNVDVNVNEVAEALRRKMDKAFSDSLKSKHEMVIPKIARIDPAKFIGRKVEDYAICSCGVEGCDLYKLERG